VPRSKPVPTLAALRAIAKRKGQAIVRHDWVIRVCEGRTWWLQAVFGPLNILTGGTVVRSETTARVAIFAALSALPDAPLASRNEAARG
jgi:hypothetical protein